jgi:hypothetical protein
VLLTETPEGGWGLGGHANTNAVGRSSPASRRACTPDPALSIGTRACPRPEDRLPSAPAGLSAIPFYLLGQAGNDPP